MKNEVETLAKLKESLMTLYIEVLEQCVDHATPEIREKLDHDICSAISWIDHLIMAKRGSGLGATTK